MYLHTAFAPYFAQEHSFTFCPTRHSIVLAYFICLGSALEMSEIVCGRRKCQTGARRIKWWNEGVETPVSKGCTRSGYGCRHQNQKGVLRVKKEVRDAVRMAKK